MKQFKIENMRSIEDLAKSQISTFRMFMIGFLVLLLAVILCGFFIISSNQDRVYVFDGTYGVKRVERMEDKVWYFSASYCRLLLDGTKYTFDTTVTTAYNLSEKGSPAQDYIKAIWNSKFYETAATENAQLLCSVDSIRFVGNNPTMVDVFMTNDRINQYGRVRKSQVLELTIGAAAFSERNPFGLKVHKIELRKDDVVGTEENKENAQAP